MNYELVISRKMEPSSIRRRISTRVKMWHLRTDASQQLPQEITELIFETSCKRAYFSM